VAHVTKVGQLAFLVGNISTVLVDLCMPPIPRSPRDPGKASHPRGGRHYPGALAGGLLLWRGYMGLGVICSTAATHADHLLFLLSLFLFSSMYILEMLGSQYFSIPETALPILSSIRIQVGSRSSFARCVPAKVPNYCELVTRGLGQL
jgi:hypothetical protein